MDGRPLKIQSHTASPLGADQIPLLQHLLIILTGFIHRRPDRYHQFDPHLLQFPYHPLGIRPVIQIEFPFSLLWPVEEINDDQIDRKISAFVLPCHFKQFLLCLIAEFALPEAEPILRHHRHRPRHLCISLLDLCRCISRHDPVIQHLCGIRLKTHNIPAKDRSAHTRIIP